MKVYLYNELKELRMYQVKFTNPKTKETVYGVVRSYFGNEKRPPKGMAKVDDSLYPRCYLVPESELTEVVNPHDWRNCEIQKFIDADFMKAKKHADSLPANKIVAGKIFDIGVADGCAWYIITKVNKKTCNVEWRGWGGGDRYTDHYFGWERKGVSIADVERYVHAQDFWRNKKSMVLK